MAKQELTPEQQQRLDRLEAEIGHDKMTIGFSVEARDPQGVKKWALFSTTVSRQGDGPGWTTQEAQLVSCIMSKQVVTTTYRDAFRRGIMGREAAAKEAQAIVDSYDANIANLLKNGGDDE
jgi:hypothetical protein